MTLHEIVKETDWPAVNYAKWILEFELSLAAMHGRYYVELITDTITAVSKSRRWTTHQAYKHLVRAVRLAKEQGISVEMPEFFQKGIFDRMRPKSEMPFNFPRYEHYGKGYGTGDMLWLFDRYQAKCKSIPHRALTEAEVEGLLRELDQKRGGAPEWRR